MMFTFPCDDPECQPAKARPYSRDRAYPSVTTLIGQLDKPGLSWAAAKETAIFCLNRTRELADMDYTDAVDRARRHHRVLWDNAANLGTLTHMAAEAFAAGAAFEAPDDMADDDFALLDTFIGGLTAWWEKRQPEVLATELIVRRDQPNYIGSIDQLALIDGVPTILDFKMTKKVDGDGYVKEWELQTGAYGACDTICHYHAGKLAATLPWTDDVLPRAQAAMIVNVMGDGTVREFTTELPAGGVLGVMASLCAVKAYKPAMKQTAAFNEPEIIVYEPRPEAPVSVEAMLD